MALNSKDWDFVYGLIEEATAKAYERGYSDAQAKKPRMTESAPVKMSRATRMRLVTLHTQLSTQTRNRP